MLQISICVGSCVWACMEIGSCEYKTYTGFAWIFICVPYHSNTTTPVHCPWNIVHIYAHGLWKDMRCVLQGARGQFLLSGAFLLSLFKNYFLLEYSLFTMLHEFLQQSESPVHIHTSPLFWISFPLRSWQISFPLRSRQCTEKSSLSHTVGSH